ncbi:sulfatase-like hydrolase/transferase, partial [Candidatus Hydrogenedentota bacterium]
MPTRREFIRVAAAAGPLAALSCVTERKHDALRTPKPNIIFFLADDMGLGDTHVYQDYTKLDDAQQVVTPNMERLASKGVRFLQAYSPGAACAPTRRSIMMGEYMRREFGAATTLPQALKKGGYRTYGVGKWHLPFAYGPTCRSDVPIALGPFSIGFDHYAGTRGNIRKSGAYYVDRTVMKYDEDSKSLRPNDSDKEPGYDKPGGPREEISQQFWLDYGRRWISGHLVGGTQAHRPFFLYYPSHANHVHHRPPDKLDEIPVVNMVYTADGKPLDKDRNNLVKVRSEMIYENDVAVGILLDWLEKHDDPRNPGHKMIDNTLFVFTSDNGAESAPGTPGQGQFRGRKTNPWEAGSRVPFIARWGKQFPEGSTSNQIFSGVDFFATFAAVAG